MNTYSEVEQYVLELGVDVDDGRGRVCVLEVGPFATEDAAVRWADSAGNVPADELLTAARREGLQASEVDAESAEDMARPISGATLNVYTDRWGTDHDLTRDLY